MRSSVTRLTLRRSLERELGHPLHDAPRGAVVDLRAKGYLQISLVPEQLSEVLLWWDRRELDSQGLEAFGDLSDRLSRLELLAAALLPAALPGRSDKDHPLHPAEREILVGLERLQHWSVGEPNPRRARAALESTLKVFHRYYSVAPVAAPCDGYPGLARLLRMGRALARASLEVARLD